MPGAAPRARARRDAVRQALARITLADMDRNIPRAFQARAAAQPSEDLAFTLLSAE